MQKKFEELIKIYDEYVEFDRNKIPLCAAENYVPDYAKAGLISRYEGKYISGYLGRNVSNDFIGSDYLEKLLVFANTLGAELFGAKYCDFRCLTGMNTVALMLMILIDKKRKIAITDPLSGGHGSLPKLCDNLGIDYVSIPYNSEKMQIDYDCLNELLKCDKSISFLFFCQSDIIQLPDFTKMEIPNDMGVIYDATQTLGLIAGKQLPNPLSLHHKIIMIGGTHKTFPGVTCGFVATNDEEYIQKLDVNISPNYLRNIQPNNILSVCLSMLELMEIGKDYAENIITTANKLGTCLENRGVSVKKISETQYTQTHQIYIQIHENEVDEAYRNFRRFGISLNKRVQAYATGFRLGVQEIARYDMSKHLEELSELIALILHTPAQEKEIFSLRAKLSSLKTELYYVEHLFREWD